MPAPPLPDIRIPRSELDRLHAEIAAYLAQHAPAPAPARGLDVDDLIRQAGIQLGPAPRPRRRILGRRRGAATVTVADHLLAVARVIETRGWAQRTLVDARGGVCILGAQALAVAAGFGDRSLAGRAGDWLNRQVGGGISYWDWQDNRWRTRRQVLDLLQRAANDARKAGI